jgi:hypothetical protein
MDTTQTNTVANDITAESNTLFTQARTAIEDALETTVEAVKDHPVAAAAIAAGAAAAVAGAAFGASKYIEKGTTAKRSPSKGGSTRKA